MKRLIIFSFLVFILASTPCRAIEPNGAYFSSLIYDAMEALNSTRVDKLKISANILQLAMDVAINVEAKEVLNELYEEITDIIYYKPSYLITKDLKVLFIQKLQLALKKNRIQIGRAYENEQNLIENLIKSYLFPTIPANKINLYFDGIEKKEGLLLIMTFIATPKSLQYDSEVYSLIFGEDIEGNPSSTKVRFSFSEEYQSANPGEFKSLIGDLNKGVDEIIGLSGVNDPLRIRYNLIDNKIILTVEAVGFKYAPMLSAYLHNTLVAASDNRLWYSIGEKLRISARNLESRQFLGIKELKAVGTKVAQKLNSASKLFHSKLLAKSWYQPTGSSYMGMINTQLNSELSAKLNEAKTLIERFSQSHMSAGRKQREIARLIRQFGLKIDGEITVSRVLEQISAMEGELAELKLPTTASKVLPQEGPVLKGMHPSKGILREVYVEGESTIEKVKNALNNLENGGHELTNLGGARTGATIAKEEILNLIRNSANKEIVLRQAQLMSRLRSLNAQGYIDGMEEFDRKIRLFNEWKAARVAQTEETIALAETSATKRAEIFQNMTSINQDAARLRVAEKAASTSSFGGKVLTIDRALKTVSLGLAAYFAYEAALKIYREPNSNKRWDIWLNDGPQIVHFAMYSVPILKEGVTVIDLLSLAWNFKWEKSLFKMPDTEGVIRGLMNVFADVGYWTAGSSRWEVMIRGLEQEIGVAPFYHPVNINQWGNRIGEKSFWYDSELTIFKNELTQTPVDDEFHPLIETGEDAFVRLRQANERMGEHIKSLAQKNLAFIYFMNFMTQNEPNSYFGTWEWTLDQTLFHVKDGYISQYHKILAQALKESGPNEK